MPDFPVPVLAAALVACPHCKCAVMRADLGWHMTMSHDEPPGDMSPGSYTLASDLPVNPPGSYAEWKP